MQPRVLATHHGQYELNDWDGQNHSMITPVCDRVLVLVDKAQEATNGGIIVPGTIMETQTLGSTTGILVAVGPQAFAYDAFRTVRWEGDRPKPGDRVVFTRYAGQEYTGLDQQLYRLMEDRSVGGVMRIPEGSDEPLILGEGYATSSSVLFPE